MLRAFILLQVAALAGAWQHAGSPPGGRAVASRVSSSAIRAGLFDGVKDAFANPSAPQDADRVTPIDRWLGIDKDLTSPKMQKTFVDPQDAANYRSIALPKPMGIKFLENGNTGGIVVEGVLPEGSAASTSADIVPGDQLVAVGDDLVMGLDFDAALGAIQNAEGEQIKLTFFRGADEFLYGPTSPDAEWLRSNAMK